MEKAFEHPALAPAELQWTCKDEQLHFDTTADLERGADGGHPEASLLGRAVQQTARYWERVSGRAPRRSGE